MGQNTARRILGTIILALGLILVLGIGGYFAWSEVQSAQVRAQLQSSASVAALAAAPAAAGAPAAAISTEPPPAAAQVASEPTQVKPAANAGAAATTAPKPTQTATRRPAQATATRRPATATPAPAATAVPPASNAAPVSATAVPPPPAPPPAAAGPVEPVRIAIPDLKIDAPVVPMGWEVVQTTAGPVSQWVIPKDDAGHHINSAGLGERGNLVISGHNNIFGEVFKPISLAWDNDARIKVDDFTDRSDILNGRRIDLFDAQGKQYTYTITEFYRLKDTGVSQAQRLANGRYILPTEDERVTLVTCWPPTNNTHRLIVVAKPVD